MIGCMHGASVCSRKVFNDTMAAHLSVLKKLT